MFLMIDMHVLFEEDIFCFINSALNFSFFWWFNKAEEIYLTLNFSNDFLLVWVENC